VPLNIETFQPSNGRTPREAEPSVGLAVEAGREGCAADPMEPCDMAMPSTPVLGTAFRG
jgi:thiazole synthase